MITLNEAIEYEKEKAKEQRYYANFEKRGSMVQSCLCRAEEHEQYVEWFEDYKKLKENIAFVSTRPIEDIYLEAYNKALDDLSGKLLEKAPHNYANELELGGTIKYLSANNVYMIVQQLKNNIQNADLQYIGNEDI